MKILNLITALCLVLLASSCKGGRQKIYDSVSIDLDEVERSHVVFSDIYSEVEFIPLENDPECMLSQVSKVEVTKHGFLVLDKGAYPSVLLFDHEGKYIRRIGSLGKAKGEYQNNVADVTVSWGGDTIVIATYTALLAYDVNGKFLCSKEIDDGAVMNVKGISGGYAYSTEYHGSPYALHFVDEKFSHRGECDETDGLLLHGGIIRNPIGADNENVYYYDEYKTAFYRINMNDCNSVKEIFLRSKNSLTIESFSKDDPYLEDFDCVYDFTVKKSIIYGCILMGDHPFGFELNTDSNLVKLYSMDGWMPPCDATFGDYQYALLSQEEFMSLNSSEDHHIFSGIEKCNWSVMKDSVMEHSNYVMAKLKRKCDRNTPNVLVRTGK